MPPKSTAGKSSAKKTGTRKKTNAPTTKQERLDAQRGNRQLWAVILFALGLFFFALTVIEGANAWTWGHNFMLGLFGWCAFLIAPILIYVAILATLDKPLGSVKHKLWQTGVLITLMSGATQIFTLGFPEAEGIIAGTKELFASGIALKGGGVASAVFGLPLLALFDKTGAGITVVLLIFVFLMVITGSTLIGLYHSATKPVRKLEEAYTERVGTQPPPEERQSGARFNIDVPMDEDEEPAAHDLPAHPVKSPKAAQSAAIRAAKNKLLGLEEPSESGLSDELPALEPAIEPEEEETPPSELDGIISKLTLCEQDAPLANVENERFKFVDEQPQPSENEENFLKGNAQYFADSAVATAEPALEQYMFPSIDLLDEPDMSASRDISDELRENSERLVHTLKSFGVETRIVNIARGPSVTRYELQPSVGVKISKITGLADDIALSLAAAGVRIEAPIPNKSAVGIEVPNKTTSFIRIREIIDSHDFTDSKSRLTVALGKNIEGKITTADLAKMPHLLIAGTTGSGKSVCMNSIIISLLFKSSPEEVKLIMVDPKFVELSVYNGIPHLLVPVVTDAKKAAGVLGWAVVEMENRYKAFAENGVRDLQSYNSLSQTKENMSPMPQIVIFIDELADLMSVAPKDVEASIGRLTQKARAAGMHLVIATQRPSVDVITGVIKANIPSRIAFAVSSQVDSRTILDIGGAEKLLGRGDMLFHPIGAAKPVRVQGCYVTDNEVERVTAFIKGLESPNYDQEVIAEIDRQAVAEKGQTLGEGAGSDEEDPAFADAVSCVIEAGQASTSLLQRRLKLGYSRAARLMDEMEQRGIIGPFEGSKPRAVLISRERWLEMKMNTSE